VRVLRLHQIWQAGLRADEGAAAVDPVHQVVAPDRCVERSSRADRARIVDQDVDAAEFVRRLADGFGS
jgi:hypothetical protein